MKIYTKEIECCMICNKELPDYEPQMCCSGQDCTCQGLPIEPPICSNECWDILINKKKSIPQKRKGAMFIRPV